MANWQAAVCLPRHCAGRQNNFHKENFGVAKMSLSQSWRAF
ncbi:hypothetical protein [Herbaspirillum sp.]|nr:hypothetical protein [Herbaspirillum sp.]